MLKAFREELDKSLNRFDSIVNKNLVIYDQGLVDYQFIKKKFNNWELHINNLKQDIEKLEGKNQEFK